MGNCVISGGSPKLSTGTCTDYNNHGMVFDANQCYKWGRVASINIQAHSDNAIPSDYSDFITLPWKPISGSFATGVCWTNNDSGVYKYVTCRLTGNGRIRLNSGESSDGHTSILISGVYLCK